jgi:6-phospho-3-hexuloisomerase
MKNYEELYKTILEEHKRVFEKQDTKMIENCENVINNYNRIFVIGVGREGLVARAFAMRLMHLGKEVHWIWDDTTPGMSKDDLLIAVNGSSNIGHINYVLEKAKSHGTKIMVVTGSPSGTAASSLADYVLFVPGAVYKGIDDVVPSIQPMGNLFEQHLFLLFDLMVIDLEKLGGISHEEMASNHRNIE